MSDNQQWLQLFERVSCFYRQMLMLPFWCKYPNYSSDIWDSLAIFLGYYAFERQGRRPDYFHAAVDALFYCKQQNNGNLTQKVVNNIWQHFRLLLNNQNLNHQNNPLYPSTNPDNIQRLSNKTSVIELIISGNMSPSFSTYFQKQINQDNNIQDAFNLIKSVRGIGDKVASFYLRDLVNTMNINLANVQNRSLVQPIDIWIERTVKYLANNQNMSKNQVSNWIVNTADQYNINPEHINMGIWYFCSQIIESEYRLKNVLTDLKKAQELINDFKRNIQNVCQHC